MSATISHVEYDGVRREALIILVLDTNEAEGIAEALGDNDGGAREIRELIAQAVTREESQRRVEDWEAHDPQADREPIRNSSTEGVTNG